MAALLAVGYKLMHGATDLTGSMVGLAKSDVDGDAANKGGIGARGGREGAAE